MEQNNKWHLDYGVRLDFVILLAVQIIGGIWWASSMQARLNENVQQVQEIKGNMKDIPDRLTRVETQVVNTSDMVHDIRDKVWTITNTRK